MNSKYLLLTIIATLCIVGLYQYTIAGRINYPEYRVSLGQVADFELLAPFDFPLLKSEEQLEQERRQALAKMDKPYILDTNVLFEVHLSIDELFDLLYKAQSDGDLNALRDAAQKAGFQINDSSLLPAINPKRLESAYTALKGAVSEVYRIGIYDNILADNILVLEGSNLEKHSISRYYQLEQAKRKVLGNLREPWVANLVNANAELIFKPNLVVDQAKYAELAQQTSNSISLTSGEILQNERIIRKNDRVNEADLNALRSLTQEYKNREIKKSPLQRLLAFTGLLMYIFAILFSFNYHYHQSGFREKKGTASLVTLNLGLLILVLLAVLSNQVMGLDNSLIPFAMIIVASLILIGFDFSVVYGLCGILLLAPFINWDAYAVVLLSLSTLITLLLIRGNKTHHEYLRIWIFLFASCSFLTVAIAFYQGSKVDPLLRNVGYLLISTIISVLGSAAIVAFYERRWNRATKQVLLELLDFNHPLLKKLATDAVGTYHHSLIVGNLAERAAELIGANPLLARVGSYYHDIGKIVNTDIFTENNEESSDIHVQYDPEESANLIRNHVKEGIVLATKYRIPQAVIDIIIQHHGTSSIRYFLNAAQRRDETVDPSLFQYPGPLPQSKEAVLVMLADIVESTTKAKTSENEGDIIKIIDDTIQRLIREGQLNEAPITFKELQQAKEAMIPVLESIYRKRLDYPEEPGK